MPLARIHRFAAAAPDDMSGIEQAIIAGSIDPAGIIAVFGKTEGNGLVNDFSRGFAVQSLRLLLEKHITADQATSVCSVMSGGTEGGLAPHWLVLERSEAPGSAGPALAIGREPIQQTFRWKISVARSRPTWSPSVSPRQ